MTDQTPMCSYNVKAASELLSCHPETIYKLIRQGRIKCFKLGKRNGIRITASEVARVQSTLVDTGEETGPSGAEAQSGLPSSGDLALLRESTARG